MIPSDADEKVPFLLLPTLWHCAACSPIVFYLTENHNLPPLNPPFVWAFFLNRFFEPPASPVHSLPNEVSALP